MPRRRPLTPAEAWKRLELPNTCGKCAYVRYRLKRVFEGVDSNSTVSLSRLMNTRICCPRELFCSTPGEGLAACGRPTTAGKP